MLRKIKIGIYSGVADIPKVNDLEEFEVKLDGAKLTLVKDGSEFIINSAFDDAGNDILADLKPYELSIDIT